ncbi:MAG: hypothetical protein LDL41_19150, partial [Coleofasciculus sp. S288]|nr:hypothetical protein [Coleofasciculus sp. S288]
SFGLQLVVAAIPGLRDLLQLTPINLVDSAVIGTSMLLPLLVNEGTKVTANAVTDVNMHP